MSMINTKRLTLRPFSMNDAEDMFEAWTQDERVARYCRWHPHKDISETIAFLQFMLNESDPCYKYRWAIELSSTKGLIGAIDVVDISEDGKTAEIGYLLAHEAWGKGYMAEAFSAVIKHLFSEGITQITAEHHADNPASGRVMEKCGLRFWRNDKEKVKFGSEELGDVRWYKLSLEQYIQHKQEADELFQHFFESVPVELEVINTSRNDKDFREVLIATLESGRKAVLKVADNDFTFPEKIKIWQRTVEEYRKLGYYCPKILSDMNGEFPKVQYKGRSCIAYGEEYSIYSPVEQRDFITEDDAVPVEAYEDDIWIMTAKVAAQYFSYAEYPSGYCLFETFCPSDKIDEVLEVALEWKKYVESLGEEYQPQVQRIWSLWTENRNALEPLYKDLPTSVFQADLNTTNILLDESNNFVGVYDFNLCGREVLLNYLMRETHGESFQNELENIFKRLRLVSRYYNFSDKEKQVALMLYRCLKPLWYTDDCLKKGKKDPEKIKGRLDEIERYLTEDFDFGQYMG